jgi:DnaJ-class molecular chaperone
MRLLGEIIVIGALIWLGWSVSFRERIYGPPPAPTPVLVSVPKGPAAQRIICPACKGERVVVYDSTGSGKVVDHRTQPCPVCLGKGYRLLVVTKGRKLCPDCQGMGIVYYPEETGHPIRSANCARCGATGLIADTR